MLDQSKHFQSIEPNFRSIESCLESFLKTFLFHVFKHFSNFSKLFLSLFNRSRHLTNFFVVFLRSFCKVFLSQGQKYHITLPFSFIFKFHAFLSSIFGNFEPKDFWDFCCFKLFLSKLINGFLLWDAINMILVVLI